MEVIARDINKKIPKETAFRAPDKKYYSSQEAWEKINRNKQFRTKVISELESILGYSYEKGMPMPTSVYKKLQLLEGYGWEPLYETVVNYKSNMEWALNNKSFSNENGRINYIFAIIQNHAKDTYNAVKDRKRAQTANIKVDDVVDIQPIKKTERDIRRFLDDE